MRTRLLRTLISVCLIGGAGAVLLIARGPFGCAAETGGERAKQLRAVIETLQPLARPLPPPKANDWLAQHDEPGQTFAQYLKYNPRTPTKQRNRLYILPIGDFADARETIVKKTAELMGLYFNLPVTVQETMPLARIPAHARRTHPTWGDKQILSTYVLDTVLRPRRPKDAAAYIAFTSSDLWPGKGWNFVFGQASIRGRVGVWSLYRNGDPAESDEAYRLCLLRTLKTATHETGHMFSLLHCTAALCNMNGSNHRAESDAKPLWLCPACLAKVCWATRADPAARFRTLHAFCEREKLADEAAYYKKALARLAPDAPQDPPETKTDDAR